MTDHASRAPSTTAQSVSIMRAVHQVLDDEPRILDDVISLKLLDPSGDVEVGKQLIREREAALQTPRIRALRSHVVLRSRIAEEQFRLAVERGVQQCVILGAGLDTFAYRQPSWAHSTRIFEVDHRTSQHYKRGRLSKTQIPIPENVAFAEIDFETEILRENLQRNGVDFAKPVFFSWLGVTMYLTQDAVDAVLTTVAALPANSEIVFTFSQPITKEQTESGQPTLADSAAMVGEPWITYFTTENLETHLREVGFSHVEFSLPEDAAARYFERRTDGLPAPRAINTVIARV